LIQVKLFADEGGRFVKKVCEVRSRERVLAEFGDGRLLPGSGADRNDHSIELARDVREFVAAGRVGAALWETD
jgi:hypothetical protein